jgi:type IV pilus assembly protein PilB
MDNFKTLKLGDLLVKSGVITLEQLGITLEIQKETRQKVGEILIDQGYVSSRQIVEVLEYQLGIPQVDLTKYNIDPEIPKILTEDFSRKNSVLPISKSGMILTVAMSDPLNIILINDLEIITGYTIEPRIAEDKEIRLAIDNVFSKSTAEQAVEDVTKEFVALTEDDLDENILRDINNAPVVRLVNTIILQAANINASDIHIEPEENSVRIRYRIDGDLLDIMRPAKQTQGAIITRIKIMAKLNIAERRIPQDGRIEMDIRGRDLDLRVSTLPTIYGEKVVIRMLDRSNFLKTSADLGFNDRDQKLFNDIIKSRNGMILVTGPTGSGKSTTMYAILKALNDSKKNIMTIEDPVEYRMSGITQSQVNFKAGFDFASGLRSMLRQDPDIIMVGEIRDQETAAIATRAAITGHLVLSTLHTNSAVSSIKRLMDMGVEPYLVASSTIAIIAQLLVKRICPHCSAPYIPLESERELLHVPHNEVFELHRGIGCTVCRKTGYKGRTAVYELIKLDSDARELILAGASDEDLWRYFKSKNMHQIEDHCRELVLDGTTTLEEYLRISHHIEG